MTHLSIAPRNGGFALLMVLILLTIVGSMLTVVARTSSRQMLDAIEATDGLQRKWAMRSCERLLLPQARDILTAQQEDAAEKTGVLYMTEKTIALGPISIQLIFADEDAKLDANDLLRRSGKETSEDTLRKMFRSKSTTDIIVLQPMALEKGQSSKQAKDTWSELATYEQIFAHTPPEELCQTWSRYVTCWGSGELDWHSAPRQVLEAALSPDLSMGQLARLQQIRVDQPDTNVASLLSQLELSHQQRKHLAGRLTDNPTHYSLWTQLSTDDRSWYGFAAVSMEQDKPELEVHLCW